jgi:hypothetical protein
MENGNDLNYKIQAVPGTNIAVQLGMNIYGYGFTGIAERDGDSVSLSAYADSALNLSGLPGAAAKHFGLQIDIPKVLGITVGRLKVDYRSGTLSFDCEFDGFLKECLFKCGTDGEYLLAFTLEDFDLRRIPFVGEFVQDKGLGITDASVVFSTKAVSYNSRSIAAGLSLIADICGAGIVKLIRPYAKTALLAESDAPQIYWADINKSVSVLTLHRAGFSYGGDTISFLLDASVAVKPLTLTLLGAGIGVNLDTKNVDFLISGFGVAFDNGFLTIGGAFNKEGCKYSGALIVGVKMVRVTLTGEYGNGRMLVYALVNANFGGPPAFFVTGIAAAFGYNKDIVLPAVGAVSNFPLVAAASGRPRMTAAEMIEKLDDGCIADSDGQKFISAGIKFTTFNIAESFVLFTVGFGDTLRFSLLGVSNITMPPMCDKNPIAFAQLALKVDIEPSKGILSVEAQLTSESYILDRACRLTGGFALFLWFGDNPHSGDFVISLGGYHPAYRKPAHYPDVPRIALNWQISSHLSITGEVYFALTPSCMMAGARMAAVYTDGNLKAWFIAQADFIIAWKPFKYAAHVYISLGASYTVKVWFIHHTFTVEFGADIDLWGPDFAGRARIRWFIISFTIEFGDVNGRPPAPLTYGEFEQSFLPPANSVGVTNAISSSPITISLDGRLISEAAGIKTVDSDGLSFSVTSAVPVSSGDVVICPMGDKAYTSQVICTLDIKNCTVTGITRSVPTALWGGPGELRTVVCGYSIALPSAVIVTFPVDKFISLEALYDFNTTHIRAFTFCAAATPQYDSTDSIQIITNTLNSVKAAREQRLRDMGMINVPDITLATLAADANVWFDEDVLVCL